MTSVHPPSRSSQVAVTSLLFMTCVAEQEALHDYLNRVELEALLPESWSRRSYTNT